MLTEDYLMRMISQALAALMTGIGLRKAGKYNEALQSIEQAVEQLTTLPASLIDQMDDAGILSMLTTQDRLDTSRLAILADLYEEWGNGLSGLGRTGPAEAAFARALRFNLEVVLTAEEALTSENIGKIESLYGRMKDRPLPIETVLALSDYYQRLLALDEQVLLMGGLDRQHVREVLAKLDRLSST